MLLAVVIGFAWMFLHVTAVAARDDGEMRHINQVLRLHILPHDDSDAEQALKLAVRDGIWYYMSDIGNYATSVEQAREITAQYLPYIEAAARRILNEHDSEHDVSVQLVQNQNFPAMSYAGIIFPQGRYEALQINIGDGAGGNWWCVMFPAMCLMDVAQAEVVEDTQLQEITVRPRFRIAEILQGR